MAEEFKVRAVDFEEKSAQEIERDLLEKAENENNEANDAGMEESPEGSSA